jgi:hypothetical protein
MNAYTHSFDAGKYNFGSNDFEPEKDTARPIFYMEETADPVSGNLVKREMIRIQSPGEALAVYGGYVREVDKRRFPREYEAFKKGETITDGTPLSAWGEVAGNVDFLSQLRAFGFQTVEDIARMADSALRLFHGSLTWKKKAQKFLDIQNKTKSAEAKDGEIEALRARLAALEAKGTESEPKRRGRPPRVQAEETAA